jgi:hypothetical protein
VSDAFRRRAQCLRGEVEYPRRIKVLVEEAQRKGAQRDLA